VFLPAKFVSSITAILHLSRLSCSQPFSLCHRGEGTLSSRPWTELQRYAQRVAPSGSASRSDRLMASIHGYDALKKISVAERRLRVVPDDMSPHRKTPAGTSYPQRAKRIEPQNSSVLPAAGNRSRSDRVMVAVGFNPRTQGPKNELRRGATLECASARCPRGNLPLRHTAIKRLRFQSHITNGERSLGLRRSYAHQMGESVSPRIPEL
jgi:hypothetical protein